MKVAAVSSDMPDDRPVLTLGHSPDPDDAFMWWPLTGRGEGGSGPTIDTGRFRFRGEPTDIEALNRRAAQAGDLDVTALSVRAWADVAGRYILTSCGASFGDGYGPKVVCRRDSTLRCDGCLRNQKPKIAVPGSRTSAFLTLRLLLGAPFDFVEMPFDRIIGAVADKTVGAGLIIHEGQLTFADAGLRQVVDLGEWWKERTGLPLPLGVNAVRRDLDDRFGAGSVADVAATLRLSVRHAMDHRREGLDYAMGFAMANTGGGPPVTRERVDAFVSMYVNQRTLDMGDEGREAIRRLLTEGAQAGQCPAVAAIDMA